MRILYLSYDGLTDPLGQSQIIPYLAGLSKLGYEIDIISFEKPDRWEKEGPVISKLCSDFGLNFYPQRYRKWPPVISTLLDIRKMKRKASDLQSASSYQIVHCRSYIPAITGAWMKRRFGVKFLFDMRGFYADERIDGGIWPQSNPLYRTIYRYFKRLERKLLGSADHIISLTHSARSEILNWKIFGDEDKVSVIPCCVDLEHFNPEKTDPEATSQLRIELNLQHSNPIVGYVGSTGTWYLLNDMLRYLKKLRKKYPEAVMVFLTLDEPQRIYDRADEAGLPQNAIRITPVERKLLPQYFSLFDWSVFFIQPVFSKKASSPTKHGELMSMGIPVVCNAGVGDTDSIVQDYKGGYCVAQTSDSELELAVEASPQLLDPDRESIILGAKQYFSLDKGIAKLDRIYAELD